MPTNFQNKIQNLKSSFWIIRLIQFFNFGLVVAFLLGVVTPYPFYVFVFFVFPLLSFSRIPKKLMTSFYKKNILLPVFSADEKMFVGEEMSLDFPLFNFVFSDFKRFTSLNFNLRFENFVLNFSDFVYLRYIEGRRGRCREYWHCLKLDFPVSNGVQLFLSNEKINLMNFYRCSIRGAENYFFYSSSQYFDVNDLNFVNFIDFVNRIDENFKTKFMIFFDKGCVYIFLKNNSQYFSVSFWNFSLKNQLLKDLDLFSKIVSIGEQFQDSIKDRLVMPTIYQKSENQSFSLFADKIKSVTTRTKFWIRIPFFILLFSSAIFLCMNYSKFPMNFMGFLLLFFAVLIAMGIIAMNSLFSRIILKKIVRSFCPNARRCFLSLKQEHKIWHPVENKKSNDNAGFLKEFISGQSDSRYTYKFDCKKYLMYFICDEYFKATILEFPYKSGVSDPVILKSNSLQITDEKYFFDKFIVLSKDVQTCISEELKCKISKFTTQFCLQFPVSNFEIVILPEVVKIYLPSYGFSYLKLSYFTSTSFETISNISQEIYALIKSAEKFLE